MSHAIHRVIGFEIIGPHTLEVRFGDGTEQQIDFGPVLHGVLFGPLQDLAIFNAAVIDAGAGTLIWPNGAGFDPATLHDWPSVCAELAARARTWGEVAEGIGERMEPARR
jgi:hypothetical protein